MEVETANKKEAILGKDKGVLERAGGVSKIDKKTAIGGLGVLPENYDIISLEQKGTEYFRELCANFDTWAEVKLKLDIASIKTLLKLSETDLKEVWRDELRLGKQQEKEMKEDFKKASSIFTREEQAKEFYKRQPYFYDKSGSFWLWREELTKWERVDDIDILNMINQALGESVINSKARTEILNALKQEGRKRIPFEIKSHWVQFKDKIYDIHTGENFKATPAYFVTNPIDWNVSYDPKTPTIDKLFSEWVGEEYSETLYEILAYCTLPDYPIHRLFCLVGGGMNGKGCYLRLMKKFIGMHNITSTELDTLMQSRFEVTKLYRKLVCQMGETNFNEMNKTSMLKKLTGGDVIGFEYKNKDQFDGTNYAKVVIATNSLPSTGDKTIGFYRRWCIIDFPNQFEEGRDPLETIPEKEFSNLATKCITKLSELLQSRKFTNEGTIEERKEKYESKSNFLEKFLKEATIEDFDGYITCADFFKKFNAWCKENRHRELSETSLGISMKKAGVEQQRKYFDWLFDGKGGQARCWIGIKWKE